MTSADPGSAARRWRPVADLDPFELAPLVGPGGRSSDLKQTARTLRHSFALERLTEQGWRVVACTGAQERAEAWVVDGGAGESATG